MVNNHYKSIRPETAASHYQRWTYEIDGQVVEEDRQPAQPSHQFEPQTPLRNLCSLPLNVHPQAVSRLLRRRFVYRVLEYLLPLQQMMSRLRMLWSAYNANDLFLPKSPHANVCPLTNHPCRPIEWITATLAVQIHKSKHTSRWRPFILYFSFVSFRFVIFFLYFLAPRF
jgi:hypothetical protein